MTVIPASPNSPSIDELAPEWPWYDAAAIQRAQDLVVRGRVFDYARGPEIAELEDHAAASHGRQFCLAVNSGSSALLAAFVGLGIGPGDEVIVPTFTFMTCASPLILLGAAPVLADSGVASGNVTIESLSPHLTEKTRAVVVTHLFGEPCDMDAIVSWARQHGVAVVEDCSHAHGARQPDGRWVGTQADIAVYSIGGVKAVSGGLGGLLLTDDETVYDLACLLSSFKQRSRMSIRRPEVAALADVGLGGNLRISPVAAVLAMSHLACLDELVARKQANATCLEEAFGVVPGLVPVATREGVNRGGRYGVHLTYDSPDERTRDALVDALTSLGAPVTEPKTRLLHRSSLFAGQRPPRSPYTKALWSQYFSYRRDDFPVASHLHDSWVALPATRLHGDVDRLVERYATATDALVSTGMAGV